jgi:hypothetical protein
MHYYLDRGHRENGGATDEYRQVGVFIDALQRALLDCGQAVTRTPDELDSFAGQTWALEHYAGEEALYLACHADVGATSGHAFFSTPSGRAWAERIAAAMPYRTAIVSTAAPGYERTPGCLARITAHQGPICGVLLELWSVGGHPDDSALSDLGRTVAGALVAS